MFSRVDVRRRRGLNLSSGFTVEPLIEVAELSKRYGSNTILNNVTFGVPEGQITALLGASGSGKSTLLAALTGLIKADSGSVRVRGEVIDHLAPNRRPLTLIGQDSRLFGHMTVADNIGFALMVRKVADNIRGDKVRELLELVDLSGYETSWPDELSPGQSLRVAIARALAVEPQALLLDEPFGDLDRACRRELLNLLRDITYEHGVTILVVTDDVDEAFEIGDRILILDAAQVRTYLSADEVLHQGKTLGAARLLGLTNRFCGSVDRSVLMTRFGTLRLPDTRHYQRANSISPSDTSGSGNTNSRANHSGRSTRVPDAGRTSSGHSGSGSAVRAVSGPGDADMTCWVAHPRSTRLVSAADAHIYGTITKIYPIGPEIKVLIELTKRSSATHLNSDRFGSSSDQKYISAICQAEMLWAILDTSPAANIATETKVWTSKLIGARVGVVINPKDLSPIT